MKKFTLLLIALLAVVGAKADVEWTIWEGNVNMSEGEAGAWKKNVYLGSTNFANLAVGDIIYLTFTVNDGATNGYVALYRQDHIEETWPETELINSTQSTANYAYTVTSDILALFQASSFSNLAIKGTDYTLTKVSIKKHFSIIKTVLSDDAVELGDWSGQYEVNSSKLQGIQGGDYYYMPATLNTDSWPQAQFYYAWNNLYNVGGTKHDVWVQIQEADLTNIKANDLHVKGQYYNASGLYLLHPVTSFKIGVSGYATFSANQEVTAPASVKAYRATIDGDNVQLTQFTDNIIPANTGAIIAGDQGAILEFLASSTGSTETSDLLPVASATEVTTLAESGYDLYVLYNNATKNSLALGLGDSDLNTKWGEGTTYTSKVITFTEEWKGCGWFFSDDGVDYSAYDRVQASFTTTNAGRLVVDYADGTQSYIDFESSATSATVNLDKTKRDKVKAIYFCSKESTYVPCSITLSSVTLYGTVAEFRKTTSGTLAANKAYLKIPTGSTPARLGIIFDEGETTTISELKAQKTVIDDGAYYNLAGQRVDKPTKGLYIVNGKKVIIK